MSDEEATRLLELIEQYVTAYPTSRNFGIGDLAEDLARSMDLTTDHADELVAALGVVSRAVSAYRSIESNLLG